jgi:gliding motility-associated-like protein
MKKILLISISFIIPFILFAQNKDCNRSISYNTDGIDDILIDVYNDCRKDTIITIDIDILYVPDRILVIDPINGDTIIDTGWIRCNADYLTLEELNNCVDGFAYCTPDGNISLGIDVPTNYYYYDPPTLLVDHLGWGRIQFFSNRSKFLIRLVPNKNGSTSGRLFTYCVYTEPLEKCFVELQDTIYHCDNTLPQPPTTLINGWCCDTLYHNTYIDIGVDDIEKDTLVCLDEYIYLKSPFSKDIFPDQIWSDGYLNDHLYKVKLTNETLYLYASNDFCEKVFTITIETPEKIISSVLPDTLLVDKHSYFSLDFTSIPNYNDWQIYINGQEINGEYNIQFSENTFLDLLIISPNNCIIKKRTIILTFKDKIYIPNCFSPNGDGYNDIFTVFPKDLYVNEYLKFLIVDRWGNIVYEEYNTIQLSGWNGMFKGKQCPVGVYAYLVQILNYNNTPITFKGGITLIR